MKSQDVLNLLDKYLQFTRLNELKDATKVFNKLILADCEIIPEIYRKIYDLGEIFSTLKGGYWINLLEDFLKKKESFFSRLIRQEIMYYDNNFGIKDLIKINKEDLQKFPNNPHFLNFKALIFLENEEYDKALNYIDQTLDLDKNNTDFLRNKAIILMFDEKYEEAHRIIQYALGLEANYSLLKETQERINNECMNRSVEDSLIEIEEKTEKHARDIKNFKLDFIQLSALFVVILTIVVRMVTFNYENFKGLTFSEIVLYQIAINFSWFFSLILIMGLIIFIHIKRNN